VGCVQKNGPRNSLKRGGGEESPRRKKKDRKTRKQLVSRGVVRNRSPLEEKEDGRGGETGKNRANVSLGGRSHLIASVVFNWYKTGGGRKMRRRMVV